jgi:hypothetical protein
VKVWDNIPRGKYFLPKSEYVGRMNVFRWRDDADSKYFVFNDRVKVAIHAGFTRFE